MPDYDRGYGDAARKAVALLHDLAKDMNDPRASALLNGAAFQLGNAFARERSGTGRQLCPPEQRNESR